MIALDLECQNPSSVYQIEIQLTKIWYSVETGQSVSIGSKSYTKYSPNSYSVAGIGLNYTGVIDIDALLAYSITNNHINATDTLNNVRLWACIINGSASIDFTYKVNYTWLVGLRPGKVANVAGLPIILNKNATKLSGNQFV